MEGIARGATRDIGAYSTGTVVYSTGDLRGTQYEMKTKYNFFKLYFFPYIFHKIADIHKGEH